MKRIEEDEEDQNKYFLSSSSSSSDFGELSRAVFIRVKFLFFREAEKFY